MARIIVIDDDPQVNDVVRRTLEGLGHRVTVHADGAAGVASITAGTTDLVITDVFMPGQDGIVTLLRLRKAFPQLRVIVMSGGDSTGVMDLLPDALQLGAAGTLAKPFKKQDLIDVVQRVLGGGPPA